MPEGGGAVVEGGEAGGGKGKRRGHGRIRV
jgi:hypothetical protein